MQVIGKNILFKPFKPEDKTEGGLFVPDSVKKDSDKGEIVQVGSKVKNLKAGDIGFRVQGWGDEVIIDGEKHFIMNESAILSLV